MSQHHEHHEKGDAEGDEMMRDHEPARKIPFDWREVRVPLYVILAIWSAAWPLYMKLDAIYKQGRESVSITVFDRWQNQTRDLNGGTWKAADVRKVRSEVQDQ